MKVEILKQYGYHFLWIDGEHWMWDVPVERKIQKSIARQAYGDVLVAGYGLGLVQEYLSKNKKVKKIVTVEKYPEIIKVAKETYGKLYGEVVVKDFYKFRTIKKFDCVIGDIWADITEESLADYNKFYKKARTLVKSNGEILAWGKDFFDFLNIKRG